jgi:erythronate-4-phosphate dehydrogenase
MKKGVWFINTSRGDVADSASLKKSAKAGRFAGIVCDVWEHEPDIDHELMDISYISTPHIAGYSTDGKANGTSMVINELARFFDLPLKDWYPSAIPGPEKPIININGKNKETETIIREAVNHTYNITEDDLKLRFSPSEFDKIRGEYPSRREFPAYTVNLVNSKKSTSRILAGMGFKCV